MNRRQLLAAAAAAAATAAPTALHAGEHEDNDGIVGSWFGTVTATNPPVGQFNEMASFHADGIVTESRRYLIKPTPFGDLLETTGHGAWTPTGPRTFQAFFRFFIQNADTGTPIGTDNVRLSLRLSRNGASLTGTFVSQIKDPADVVIFQVEGDYSATRISV
jgi:hypothetical protein